MISIIVTIYNSELYLKDCLESLHNQTYSDFEVIMINDGSTDESRAIALSYTQLDSRFTLVDSEHVEYPEACNIGLKHINGDYIIYFDSDDIADANWLMFLYNSLIENNADISMCTSNRFINDEQKDIQAVSVEDLNRYVSDVSKVKMNYLFDDKVLGNLWNKLVKKELYNDIIFPKDFPAQSDIYATCKILDKAEKVVFVNLPLVNFRRHNNSRMAKAGHGNEYWKFRIELFLDLIEPIWDKYPYTHFICKRYMNGLLSRVRLDYQVDKDYYNDVILSEKNRKRLDKMFLESEECNFDVDLVVPFVDDRDEVWQEAYKKTFNREYRPDERFDDHDLFKNFIKGVDKFMPWIRKIHLIVSNIEQVPDYINKEKTHIVLHSDIIPSDYLPTFNSQTIEMFIHNIEDLSEHFIYSNDDMYPINYLNKSDFFTIEGKPKIIFKKEYTDKALSFFQRVCLNNYQTVANALNVEHDAEVIKPEHSMTSMILSDCKKCFDLIKEDIYKTIYYDRKSNQFNQYIYPDYERLTENYVFDGPVFKYDLISDEVDHIILDTIENSRCQIYCLNNINVGSERLFNNIQKSFDKILN